MSDKPSRPQREEYGYLCPVDSRWSDNDIYGHINNVVYYSYFDSTINRYLVDEGGLDIHEGEHIAYVRYGLALFGSEGPAKATGFVVHVFVNRATGRPVAIPDALREALARLAQ